MIGLLSPSNGVNLILVLVIFIVVLKVGIWVYQNKFTWLCIWMHLPTIWVNDYYKSIFFSFHCTKVKFSCIEETLRQYYPLWHKLEEHGPSLKETKLTKHIQNMQIKD